MNLQKKLEKPKKGVLKAQDNVIHEEITESNTIRIIEVGEEFSYRKILVLQLNQLGDDRLTTHPIWPSIEGSNLVEIDPPT